MGMDAPVGGNTRFLGENTDGFQGPRVVDPRRVRQDEIDRKKQETTTLRQQKDSYESGLKEGYDAMDISTQQDAFTNAPTPKYSEGQIERVPNKPIVENYPNPSGAKVQKELSLDKRGIPSRPKAKPPMLIAGGPSMAGNDAVLDPRLAEDGMYTQFEDPTQEDGKGYKRIGKFEDFTGAEDIGTRQKAEIGLRMQNKSLRKSTLDDYRLQKEEITGKIAELATGVKSATGDIAYDGKMITMDEAQSETLRLQKKRAELTQYHANTEDLFRSNTAGDDLRYATRKALGEGRDPNEDPIVMSLRKSNELFGRKVDSLNLDMPDDVSSNDISKKMFYENKGLEMEAQDRAKKAEGDYKAKSEMSDLSTTEVARDHFYKTAPFETLKTQTDLLIKDTNKLREEAGKNWAGMDSNARQLFIERFSGRQEAIGKAKQQLSGMVPAVNKSAEETNAKISAADSQNVKDQEAYKAQVDTINKEMKARSKAVYQRGVAASEKKRTEQQATLDSFSTALNKGNSKDITEASQKMVDQGVLTAERVKQSIEEYNKLRDSGKQSFAANTLGTFYRASLVASQETARGAFSIAANTLRLRIAGKDSPSLAPDSMKGVATAVGRASLFANPGQAIQQGFNWAGQKLGDKVFEYGLKNSETVKSVAEFVASALEEAAQSAKENKEAINKAIPVDQSFENSTGAQVLKTMGETPWMLLPYAFGAKAGFTMSGALNVSRLYSEAREDQDQSYQAKLEDWKAGKLKQEPQPLTEADAHEGAIRYAVPSGVIDTISDRIGIGILAKGFKGGAKIMPKNLATFFKALAQGAEKEALPIWMAAPTSGVIESVSETSQQAILNGLATKYENWDPKREWNAELAQSALVGGLAGLLLPVVGGGAGAVYRKTVVMPQFALDNKALDQIADEFRGQSQDVELGGWAKFAQAIMPETDPNTPTSAPVLSAKAISTPENQLRGSGVKWAIVNGMALDMRITKIQSQIDALPETEGKALRQERNHLLTMRSGLVGSIQNDANVRTKLWQEISQLPNEPLRKGEQSLHEIALIAAKLSMGAPLTEEEQKVKANGMAIIQNIDGGMTISPSFMRMLGGKLPTLELMAASNQSLLEETETPAPEGAVPPKLEEAPSRADIAKERAAIGEAFAPDPEEVEQEQPSATGPSPSIPSWNVAWKRGKTSGTTQVSAESAAVAKVNVARQLRAEGLPGAISIGPAEQVEQQEMFPQDQKPLLNSAAKLAQRESPIGVNRYLRKLKGKNPEEKLADAKKRLTSFAMGMKSLYGQTVRFKEDTTTATPFETLLSDSGDISITINPIFFKKNDPEHNNRAIAEEIFHAADFIASNIEADKAGRTDKGAFYTERRSALYSKLREIGRTNEAVGRAILASASLYADLNNKEGGLTVDDTIGLLLKDNQGKNDAAFMSELLRQLNDIKRTEAVVEIMRAKDDARAGRVSSLKGAIDAVKAYLKGIYRAIFKLRAGLESNPEVAAELDATLQSIKDVLDEKDTEAPPIDRVVAKKLKDRGLTDAEINKMTPEEAEARSNTELAPAAEAGNPERLKNLTSNNVRGTKYGAVKYDIEIVPQSKINSMAGTELQPRNRTGDAIYEGEATTRANNLNPNKLLSGNELDTGMPTVIAAEDNPYGINKSGFDTIAGHGRNQSIGIAPNERKQAYIDEMRSMYPELSAKIDEILESGEMPVAVRKINWQATQDKSLGTPTQQLRRIARDANLGTGNSNESEVALSDAMEVKDDQSLSAPPEIDGSLLDPAGRPLGNRDVLDKWFAIFGSDRSLVSGDGYTKAFERRVRAAIVAYTFAPTNEKGQIKLDAETFNLINTLVSENEAKEANLTNFQAGILLAAPSLFRVRQRIEELDKNLPPEAKSANPIANIQRALLGYLNYRKEQVNSGLALSDIQFGSFVNQMGLFGESVTPVQAMILAPIAQGNGENGLLNTGGGVLSPIASIANLHSIKDSPKRIAAYLSSYANAIADAYSEYGAEAALPGMERRLTADENATIMQGALERAGAIYPSGQKQPEAQMPDTAAVQLRAKYVEQELMPETDTETKAPATGNMKIQYDLGKLERLLGASAYDANLPNVAVKELVQNAFDAIKAIGSGTIRVDTDVSQKTISVSDDGNGMTPEIIEKAFFTIGGTNKGTKPQDTSGGLGLAKMAFIMGSDKIDVTTVRDGLKSVVSATREEIRGGGIRVETTKTTEPSGTTVKVTLPASFLDANGEQQAYSFPYSKPDFLEEPLIGPVTIIHNGVTLPIGINQTNYQKETEVEFSWGKINIHIDPKKASYPRIKVLSAGLKQFNASSYEIYGMDDRKLEHDIVLDVRPSVGTDNYAYPINNTREGWRSTIKQDIEALYKYIHMMAIEQNLVNAKQTFETLEKMPRLDLNKEITEGEMDALNRARSNTGQRASAKDAIDRMEISGDMIRFMYASGKVKEHKRDEYVQKSFKPARAIDFDSIGIDTAKMDPKSPMFHSNTNLEYKDVPGANEFFASTGTALLDFVREFGAKVKEGGLESDYSQLAEEDSSGWFAGVSLDKTYRGLNMTKPMKAIWFNPLTPSAEALFSPEAAAKEALHVFIHEITHVMAKSEGAAFTGELATNHARLAKYGVDVDTAELKLVKVYNKNWEAFNELIQRFGNRNTVNRAEPFRPSGERLGIDPNPSQINEAGDGSLQGQGRASTDGNRQANQEAGGLNFGKKGRPANINTGATAGANSLSKDELNFDKKGKTGQYNTLATPESNLFKLAAKFTYDELFNDTENGSGESEAEVGATEETARVAGIVRNMVAPPETAKRGSGEGERNERTRPGGSLINSFVRSHVAERFYVRGYGQDELRELTYDKIMDILSKSPSGQNIARSFLQSNPVKAERPEGLMELVRTLVARAKQEGNANPTGADLNSFMTDEEKKKNFTEAQLESARSERHLYNYIMRSLTNMVAKMTGNEADEGKVIAQSQIENRYNDINPESDTEDAFDATYGAGQETNISNIPLTEFNENFSKGIENGSVATSVRTTLGLAGTAMAMHARGMSNKDIAEELQITGAQRNDAVVWRIIREGYQRMQRALDFIQESKAILEAKTNLTEDEEKRLDDLNEYLSGFSKSDFDAIKAKQDQRIEAEKAIEETRLQAGEAVQGRLFAKTPDARIVTKYYELQNKIRTGEVTPREMDMYDKIESMAIKYRWPGVPVQTRLFEMANQMRRSKPTPETFQEMKQMDLMLDEDTLKGLSRLQSKPVARMGEAELAEELDGDWMTEEEVNQALEDDSIGRTRGLGDYGETSEASAGVRAAQEMTPAPTAKSIEETASASMAIPDKQILERLRQTGVQLSDEETVAARRVSSRLWQEAVDSGDEVQINRALLVTRDYIRTGTEQARGLSSRRNRSQEDENRSAVHTPIIAILDRELITEASKQNAEAIRDASSKKARVADAKSKLSAADQQRPDWKEWFDTQEKEIAEHEQTTKDKGLRKAEEAIIGKKRKKADDALAVVGRSLSGLEDENATHKLRTGETMNQILQKVGDPILREAVRMYTQGMAIKEIESILGRTGLKVEIGKAITKGLQPEVDRRFQRLYDEVEAKKLTKKQLMAKLKKLSDGQSLMAKVPEDEGAPLSREEARQAIFEAFGLTPNELDRGQSAALFNYADKSQVSKMNSLINQAVNEPASWAKIASDVFASFIFSGAPSLISNVALTPLAPFTVPLHLFAEALTSRLKGNVKMSVGGEVLGTPYKNFAEAVSGGLSEARSALSAVKQGAVKAALARGVDAFMNEFSSFGSEQGIAPMGMSERESGMNTKSIPGMTGRVIRSGINVLLAGDEFSKNMRANMYVGAFAYRVGKARSLTGEALHDFIESEIADKESLSWDLAIKRTLRDTFGQSLTKKGKKFKSLGEVIGLIPSLAQDLNKSAGQYADDQKFSGFKVGGRMFSPAEFVTKFFQSFFLLIKSPYNIARAAGAYSPLAGINVMARNARGTVKDTDETGKDRRYMDAQDYNASVQRHSEALIGLAGMAALWSAFEGDDDDDKKYITITGSSSTGPKTRYGNQATTIKVGGVTIPYGRYEPLSGLAYLADLAREAKQVQKGNGNIDERAMNWARDFLQFPFSKTFSKAFRDATKLATIKGAGDVMQGRISSLVVPNLFRRLFEPGAITAGEEEWDAERLSGWNWTEMAGWVNATLPGLPSLLKQAGVEGEVAEGLPPRYLADLSVKKREVTATEYMAKSLGASDRLARLAGGISRGVIPSGGAYVTPEKTRLERFVSSYNARFPQTPYNPKPPNRFIRIKDKNGISRSEEMRPGEYKLMLDMASKLGTERINSVLSDKGILNPSENMRKLVDKIREDAVTSAREAIGRARRVQSEKLLSQPTASK